jgi:serine/threonine protein kinase
LFTEANHGDLQQYLDTHNADISITLRLTWCRQAAEAIAHLHSKGVIHSDLRPENYLLHTYNNDSIPNLLLSDFGGSYCKTNGTIIDGGHLPDPGFFNPNKEWVSNKDTDVFALGSVLYTIMTDHWPYRPPGAFSSVEEWEEYEDRVDELFMKGKFPSIEGLVGGDVISDCWNERIGDAGVIVERYEALMRMREEERRGFV